MTPPNLAGDDAAANIFTFRARDFHLRLAANLMFLNFGSLGRAPGNRSSRTTKPRHFALAKLQTKICVLKRRRSDGKMREGCLIKISHRSGANSH